MLNGSTLLKKTAIESFTCFSSEAIAKAIDKLKLNENSTESTCTINETFIPQATVAQSELLDQILNRLKVFFSNLIEFVMKSIYRNFF